MTTRITDIEIKMYLEKIGLCVNLLKDIPTGDLLHEFSMNDALGPLLDPTGWMKISNNARKNEQVVRALATFMTEVRKAWPEIDEDPNA